MLMNCKMIAQTLVNCNRDCRIKKFVTRVPKNFCMPQGYWITHIIDTVDLTSDNRADLIIRWRKKKFSEGDTIRITIFPQNTDGTFSKGLTLNNLYIPSFTDYTEKYNTGDPKLDSTYSKFIYSNYDLVEFKPNVIMVGFFTDAGGGVDFYFSYRKDLRNWLLYKKVYWNQTSKITGKEVTTERKPQKQISISEFKIIDFIE